jgi:hypothetical protein
VGVGQDEDVGADRFNVTFRADHLPREAYHLVVSAGIATRAKAAMLFDDPALM